MSLMHSSGRPSSHHVTRKGEVSELIGKIREAWNSMQLCLLPQSFPSPWHVFFAQPCVCKPWNAVQLWAGKDRGEEKPCRGVCFNAHAIIRKQAKLRIACLGRLRACDKQESWRNICLMVKREKNKAKLFCCTNAGSHHRIPTKARVPSCHGGLLTVSWNWEKQLWKAVQGKRRCIVAVQVPCRCQSEVLKICAGGWFDRMLQWFS